MRQRVRAQTVDLQTLVFWPKYEISTTTEKSAELKHERPCKRCSLIGLSARQIKRPDAHVQRQKRSHVFGCLFNRSVSSQTDATEADETESETETHEPTETSDVAQNNQNVKRRNVTSCFIRPPVDRYHQGEGFVSHMFRSGHIDPVRVLWRVRTVRDKSVETDLRGAKA
ncbi:hypothetical protein F2P81_013363 [Scophthalmus maximus]|uniref:Uncharacterized protein n=1 Tax=Scophthalmus maximus TaxID=52904 RepID=A0A6A4SSL3_SCOMX|nr:hypothetical protein F2P81_013363 [Scophthalmus maximus]